MALLIDGVAIVTGAGSGIGRECCLAYAAEGARGVVLADVDHAAVTEAAREASAVATHAEFRALALRVDVADPASCREMVRRAVEAFGRVDYLVNSAGVGVRKPAPIHETDTAEMERFWRVNVMGSLHCIQAAVAVMKTQPVATSESRGRRREVGRGVILNVGSCNSFAATPNITQYTTSKHAVMGMTKNAALDLAPYGIRVNAICPGWVDTPMVDAAIEGNPDLQEMIKSIVPMRRIARPEEIADLVLFMTSPRSSYVTGAGWVIDGGASLQVRTS